MASDKKRYSVKKEETVAIIKAYKRHPSNWPVIIEEVKANIGCLPEAVRKMYQTGDFIKLKRRMCDQVSRLLTVKDDELDAELRPLVQNIKQDKEKLMAIYRTDTTGFSKRKATTTSESESPQLSNTKKPLLVNKTNIEGDGARQGTSKQDERQTYIQQSDESADEDIAPQPPRKTNSELAREANEEYLTFARQRLPRLMDKMEAYMDKVLKEK